MPNPKIAALALIVLAACARPSTERAIASNQQAAEALTVQEAIDSLPHFGQERLEGKSPIEWTYVPAVLRVRDHLEDGGELTDAQWRTLIKRTGAIRARERWPVDQPIAMFVSPPWWMSLTRITVRPRREGLVVASGGDVNPGFCGTCSEIGFQRERYQEIGTLPLGKHLLEFDVVIETRAGSMGKSEAGAVAAEPTTAWAGLLAFDVEVVPSVEGAIGGRSDSALDAAVKERLRLSVSSDGVVQPFPRAAKHGLPHTALSTLIELREEGRTYVSSRVVVTEHGIVPTEQSEALRLPEGQIDRSKWTVRVSGGAEGVLRCWEADHFWNGDYEIPLSELPTL